MVVNNKVSVERDDHVGIVRIERPPANFFDFDVIREISDGIDSLVASGARSIVLGSKGKHFCAGADFSGQESGASDRYQSARRLYSEAKRIFYAPVPIVAAVQGSAVGGGLGLACAADFRVAGHSSRFIANFSRLGFHHGFALSVSLPAIVGHQNATRMLYSSMKVTAEAAERMGLVDELVEDSEIQGRALELAREISECAPLAVQSMKRTMTRSVRPKIDDALDRELSEQTRLWSSEDSQAGVSASLRRETPVFVGR